MKKDTDKKKATKRLEKQVQDEVGNSTKQSDITDEEEFWDNEDEDPSS